MGHHSVVADRAYTFTSRGNGESLLHQPGCQQAEDIKGNEMKTDVYTGRTWGTHKVAVLWVETPMRWEKSENSFANCSFVWLVGCLHRYLQTLQTICMKISKGQQFVQYYKQPIWQAQSHWSWIFTWTCPCITLLITLLPHDWLTGKLHEPESDSGHWVYVVNMTLQISVIIYMFINLNIQWYWKGHFGYSFIV